MAALSSAPLVFTLLWISRSVAALDFLFPLANGGQEPSSCLKMVILDSIRGGSALVFYFNSEVKATPGEDVTLQCHYFRKAAITALSWSRPSMDNYVFYFTDNKSMERYQHPRYRGRVELKDPDMKNGDASVLLKNVSKEDSGTYECWVTSYDMVESVNSVHLSVSEGFIACGMKLSLSLVVLDLMLDLGSSGTFRVNSESNDFLFLPFEAFLMSKDDFEVKAKPGEDVTLQCNSSRDAAVTDLMWNRPDREDDYVFFFRDNRLYEQYQDPRCRGRVELKDPEMKNGEFSILLKNVSVNDSGTYECWVQSSSMRRLKKVLMTSVQLSVSEGTQAPRPDWLVLTVLRHLAVFSPYCASTFLMVSMFRRSPPGSRKPVSETSPHGEEEASDGQYDDVTSEHHF
ncbi:hypothetical protein NQZ68_032829 [Dissostichus eleginoides]|nr:hypothetical protein NQZ68_032829 [Dissostichus eleginoides]